MVSFLISAAFWVVAAIKGRRLLQDGDFSDLSINGAAFIRGRHLIEARHLEEIR